MSHSKLAKKLAKKLDFDLIKDIVGKKDSLLDLMKIYNDAQVVDRAEKETQVEVGNAVEMATQTITMNATFATIGTTATVGTTASDSSSSSSSSSSDSDSSSSSSSNSSDSDSSSSSSDSDDDDQVSDSATKLESPKKKIAVAKLESPKKKTAKIIAEKISGSDSSSSSSDSDSSSSSSSSSDSDSDSEKTTVVAKKAEKEKKESKKRPATALETSSPASCDSSQPPATKKSKNEQAIANRFQRIKSEEVVFQNEGLKDNTFEAKGGAFNSYGHKAHLDLIVTRGKGFRKEKDKKKRGSYRGGAIDFQSHSIKFPDSD